MLTQRSIVYPAGNRVTLVMSRKDNYNEILFMVYTLWTDNEFVANVCKLLLTNSRYELS